MTVGERIKEMRKYRNMTQKQLAKAAGVATGTIQQYELGKREPRLKQLQSISSCLGISVEYLLSGGTDSTTHLANGVHIYKNTFPFAVMGSVLNDFPDDSYDILYQDEYLLIVVEKGSSATSEELKQIVEIYRPKELLENANKSRINAALDQLNDEGQSKAVERVEELTEIPKYKK